VQAFLIQHEGALRAAIFFGLLAALSLAESLAPRRARVVPRRTHALHNLLLVAVDSFAARLVLPAGAVGVALLAEAQGLGTLHHVAWPGWLELTLALLALDLALWAQHVATHRVPLLWRLHKVHHADLDLDATSGVRFHPLEILLSLAWKAALIVALGVSPAAVVLFEVILNGMAVFNHANVRIPRALDTSLRKLIVTPDMHRVHHSVLREETNSNFGFNLVLWDHMFGTYRAEPRDGQVMLRIGLTETRDPRTVARVLGMLWLPFRRQETVRTRRSDITGRMSGR
jgi:sterol desaturase/sphingolipid hydroxylase (fatty acid hydroxylase superfamily)